MDELNRPSSPSPPPPKPETLQTLATGALFSSVSTLVSSSRTLPSTQDFHFFNNFDEFKLPVKHVAAKSYSMLHKIGESSQLWGKRLPFRGSDDDDDLGYEWLANVNDEIFERFDMSKDEFERVRKKEEETRTKEGVEGITDGGFQLVYGKKKSKAFGGGGCGEGGDDKIELSSGGLEVGVKVAVRDKKGRVQFHIPTIRKPQEEYKILVNNSNQPFQHVWLERSEDGTRIIHPLEKLAVLDFVDRNVEDIVLVKPPALECTPFKLVEEVKDLKDMVAKLHGVNEFAVDLEHNQYRSFQGLTCLMQISTRTEDFIVDTLKLRIHVGPYLREIFKDPTKKKVMHGADRDITWLQRDFGIYVCNLFDTGQASRILKLERNSLEYLLHHFCGVTANKEYQNADWRLRPLPDEMLRYAREDTHYLLYIYDLMRKQLFSMPKESEQADAPLVEVYKRSYDICMQLYEKEILSETSYLYTYGLQGAQFKAQQLAVLAGLYEWRDAVARAEDESTGYILPNKSLIEIAKQMPVTTSQLRRLVKAKHPYVERNLASVVSIIRDSMQNAAAFEAVAEHLKSGRVEVASQESTVANNAEKQTVCGSNEINGNMSPFVSSADPQEHPLIRPETSLCTTQSCSSNSAVEIGKKDSVIDNTKNPGESLTVSNPNESESTDKPNFHMTKDTGATIQVLKKPSRAFGALLGNSVSKRKPESAEKDMGFIKLEQIRSSVNLCFPSFVNSQKPEEPVEKELTEVSEIPFCGQPFAPQQGPSKMEEIIMLEDGQEGDKSLQGDLPASKEEMGDNSRGPTSETNEEDEPVSLNDLSSSFQKCFQSIKHSRKSKQADKSQESRGFLQLKPFDYDSAREHVRFGELNKPTAQVNEDLDSRSGRKGSTTDRAQGDDGTKGLRQGKRRQAFPASGNRSATFR